VTSEITNPVAKPTWMLASSAVYRSSKEKSPVAKIPAATTTMIRPTPSPATVPASDATSA
jgi:hypothetical protein